MEGKKLAILCWKHLRLPESQIIWAATWQNQQRECAPSEDSDQPGHPPRLIRVFAVRMKKAWVLSYPLRAQRRLWSDWAGRMPRLIWVFNGRTLILLVLSCCGSFKEYWCLLVLIWSARGVVWKIPGEVFGCQFLKRGSFDQPVHIEENMVFLLCTEQFCLWGYPGGFSGLEMKNERKQKRKNDLHKIDAEVDVCGICSDIKVR